MALMVSSQSLLRSNCCSRGPFREGAFSGTQEENHYLQVTETHFRQAATDSGGAKVGAATSRIFSQGFARNETSPCQ